MSKIAVIALLILYIIFQNIIMSAIIDLFIASISVAALFPAAFIWSKLRTGSLEDDFSPPREYYLTMLDRTHFRQLTL